MQQYRNKSALFIKKSEKRKTLKKRKKIHCRGTKILTNTNRFWLRKGRTPAMVLGVSTLIGFGSGIQSVAAQEIPLLDCLINPYRVVDIASSVPGVVSHIYADTSAYLKAGEVAAELDSRVEQATVVLAQARADIDSEVKANSVNLAFDERRSERIQSLYDKKTVSIELKDEADRGQSLSRWRLRQAKDLKGIRVLELARAQEQLNQKTVRSPIDGFVVKRFKDVGEYVEDQPILRVAQLDPLAVEAVVPLELRSRMTKGMRALVYPETPGVDPVEAEITVIDQVADASTSTFGVQLTLPNPHYEILSGVKCTLNFGAGTPRAN